MALNKESIDKVLESLVQRERQERRAMSTITSEILSKLNISIDNLPSNCQKLLRDVYIAQITSGMEQLDPIAISLRQSREMRETLNDDYEILKLRQKNMEVQAKIDRNTKIIEELREDLAQSRLRLASQSPNPKSVTECSREVKQKLATFEESCERAKAIFSKVSVPKHIMPESLRALVASIAHLNKEATSLRQSAEEISLVKQAKHALFILKK